MTRESIALLSAALLIIGIMAPAASAVPPDISTDEWVEDWYIGECDGFSMLTEDNMEATIKFFYNKDGSVDRLRFHFTIDGIVYNSEDPSKTLNSSAHYSALTDETFEVWTSSGLFYRVELPKGGAVLMEAGRAEVDVSSGEPVFNWWVGNNQYYEQDFADICEALS
jgi:hypothetical protein